MGKQHPPEDPLGLPGLPPEWGEVRIPDDPSELAAEAEQVRRELAEQRAAAAARAAGTGSGQSQPSATVPLLIMSVAVLITLVSLFAMTWSGTPGPTGTGAEPAGTRSLPVVPLMDVDGRTMTLATSAPLVVLLVEECLDCTELIAATVIAAGAAVTVAAIGHSVPDWPSDRTPATGPAPLLLADPEGALRAGLELGPPVDAATVLLVDRAGQITRTVPAATSISQFQGDLAELGSP